MVVSPAPRCGEKGQKGSNSPARGGANGQIVTWVRCVRLPCADTPAPRIELSGEWSPPRT